GQVDPTQIQVADLNKTFNDPLAAKVRSTLRRDYNFSRTPGRTYSVPCVFSSEQLRYPKPPAQSSFTPSPTTLFGWHTVPSGFG
ncbi:hypothetical protein ACV34L_32665, partial [Pseudomonas aeruginosa]